MTPLNFAASGPILAVKTIQAINETLEKDQGDLYRKLLKEEMNTARDMYRENGDSFFRNHLGASLIGRDCSRELWYSFRWARKVKHRGRILRLFNRGHTEEPRFLALLRMIGCKVWARNESGEPFRVMGPDGHFGGSMDAVVVGVPDLPEGRPVLSEFKTHNDKSFQKLVKEGVRSAKYEHYVQMQIYMGLEPTQTLRTALYLATNKNDDDLYGEIVHYNAEDCALFYDRAVNIIWSQEAPKKISESPGWYTCKICDFRLICHSSELPEKTCRSCMYSRTRSNGVWLCSYNDCNVPLTEAQQLAACSYYRFNPSI